MQMTEPHIDPIVTELLTSLDRLGASQLTIAERAGISPPYLCQIAAGKRQPTLDVIHRLADVAGDAVGRGVDAEDLAALASSVCQIPSQRFASRVGIVQNPHPRVRYFPLADLDFVTHFAILVGV